MLNLRIDKTIEVLSSMKGSDLEGKADKAANTIRDALLGGGKLLVAGNGGSAAQAQHVSAEILATLHKEKRRGYPAIALTTDTSYLTAWLNDFGDCDLEGIFSRQVEALGSKGDVFLGISTSGNSKNIVMALNKARGMGLSTIGLLGCGGGVASPECDIALIVPSDDTAVIQEAHSLLAHYICELVVPNLK